MADNDIGGIELAAGTGITITPSTSVTSNVAHKTLTIAATGSGGEANEFSFKTIARSGTGSGASIVADTTTDTLTLSGGTNMSLTFDPTTDTITFNSSGTSDNLGNHTATQNLNMNTSYHIVNGFGFSDSTTFTATDKYLLFSGSALQLNTESGGIMNFTRGSSTIMVSHPDSLRIYDNLYLLEQGVASDVAGFGQIYVQTGNSLPYFRSDGGVEYNMAPGSIKLNMNDNYIYKCDLISGNDDAGGFGSTSNFISLTPGTIIRMNSGTAITAEVLGITVMTISSSAVDFHQPLDMNSKQITNLATPSLSSDAATKGYVDGLTGGGSLWTDNGTTLSPTGGESLHLAGKNIVNCALIGGQVSPASDGSYIVMENGLDMSINSSSSTSILLTNNNSTRIRVNSTGIGFYAATPVARASAIAAPTGGGTIDAEARTAINSIRVALSNIGITF